MSQLNSVIPALNATQDKLSFAVANYLDRKNLQQIFGREFDYEGAKNWLKLEVQQNFANFPQIEILPSAKINSALGAYAAETNTIYLSKELVEQNQSNLSAVSRVILEEYGHYLDAWFNSHDAAGDEGELFSYLVRGKSPTETEKGRILVDNDLALVEIGDRQIAIEQANPGDNPAFDLIGLTQLRNDPQFAGIDGSGFSVAVIDTGLDIDHPAIAPNYIAGYDFIDGDNNPNDPKGHGTHIAGTIGATDETIGVATDVGLISLRALDRAASGSTDKIEAALEWAYDNREQYNITAVNLSLGAGFFTPQTPLSGDILIDDIRRLEAAGVTVIAAAGNNYFANEDASSRNGIAYPGISSTIAVGAVWQDGARASTTWTEGSIDFSTGTDRIASFSQRSDADNFIFAPGTIINSTLPGGRFGQNSGTSQATPHIAGAVALLQEASIQFNDRTLTPSEVNEILQTTGDIVIDGDDEDDNVQNTDRAYVRVNIYSAVAEIKRRSLTDVSIEADEAIAVSNDTIGGAVVGPILDGSPTELIRGSIGRDGTERRDNDVDLYSFRVVSPGEVKIAVISDPTEADDFDSYLRLFDALGNQIAANDNVSGRAERTFSQIESDLAIGSYYLGVSSFNNFSYSPNVAGSGVAGVTGNYALEFSLSILDPDGILTGARDINLGSDRVISTGIIGSDRGQTLDIADVDLYRLVAPSNGTLSLDIDTPYNDFVDSYLRLFDRNGNELLLPNSDRPIANDNGLANNTTQEEAESIANNPDIVLEDSEQIELMGGTVGLGDNYLKGNYGHVTDSFLATEVEAGEVYYVGVSDTSNRNYNPNNFDNRAQNSETGAYELITTFTENRVNDITVQNDNERSVYHFIRNDLNDLNVNFYTASSAERDYILDNLNQYDFQGPAFESAPENDALTGSKPVYRFSNSSTGAHLYTMFEEERDYIDRNLANYSSDGIAYHGYEEQEAGTIPLYRLYNTNTDIHFYTSSAAQKDRVLASSDSFRLEADNGVAFYVEEIADI